MHNKQGIILLETILSIALFFIIVSVSTKFLTELQKKSHSVFVNTTVLLQLEATKQFLSNNKNLNRLVFNEQKLFYNGDLLLEKVTSFQLSKSENINSIEICIYDNVCSQWKIRD